MSTRPIVGRIKGDGFEGRYIHSDDSPVIVEEARYSPGVSIPAAPQSYYNRWLAQETQQMKTYPLTQAETTEHYGTMDTLLRVWIAGEVAIMRYYYVSDVDEAVDVIADYGDGAAVVGLESRAADEWSEWYDDRGCSIDEIVGERRETAQRAEEHGR